MSTYFSFNFQFECSKLHRLHLQTLPPTLDSFGSFCYLQQELWVGIVLGSCDFGYRFAVFAIKVSLGSRFGAVRWAFGLSFELPSFGSRPDLLCCSLRRLSFQA